MIGHQSPQGPHCRTGRSFSPAIPFFQRDHGVVGVRRVHPVRRCDRVVPVNVAVRMAPSRQPRSRVDTGRGRGNGVTPQAVWSGASRQRPAAPRTSLAPPTSQTSSLLLDQLLDQLELRAPVLVRRSHRRSRSRGPPGPGGPERGACQHRKVARFLAGAVRFPRRGCGVPRR